jgi:tetratricopeptide (TPR) repeat protein
MRMKLKKETGRRASSRAAEMLPAPRTHFCPMVNKRARIREQRIAGARSLQILGFAFLVTASFAYAESKNEAKKSYDTAINKASRDLTDGKIDDATKDAEQAEKLEPDNPETANILGVVASKKKDYPEAISQFNRALTENPKFYTAKFNLVDVLLLKGDYDQARSMLADLSQIDPKSEVVQFKFALSYVLDGKTDDAMSFIDQMDFPGKTPAYYYARAAVWLKKGLTKDANQYSVNAHKYYTDGQCSYFVSVLREMGLNVSVL